MKLNEKELKNSGAWTANGYLLPQYSRPEMIRKTKENPVWVHFGAGNLFRAFHACLAQSLLNRGLTDRGVIAVERRDRRPDAEKGVPSDNLFVAVTLKSDGQVKKEIVGSVAENCYLCSEGDEGFGRLEEIFRTDSLQLCTFTITEKGYRLKDGSGEILDDVKKDFAAGPGKAESYMGKIASLLYTRFEAGEKPAAMVSTDNCSHNGEKLQSAVTAFADEWIRRGLADAKFSAYLKDSGKITFPWTMIDKITPGPDAGVARILRDDGLEEDTCFANSEETGYLVVEDAFPNGRPALEKAGVIFTDRETVNKVERMKVTTCLNPLHTALAVYGCLLGYTRIHDEMKDEDLVALIRRLGYREGLPVVTNPGVLDPKEFLDTVIEVRLPNPFMPDMPQRIATDTSQKIPIRLGETIRSYLADPSLDVGSLEMIPLVQAGWLRYLMAVDDSGKPFEPSPDPLLADGQKAVSSFRLGDKVTAEEAEKVLAPFLSNGQIFGVDLVKAGLSGKIAAYFSAEIAGPGAVRKTIHEAVSGTTGR